MGRIRKDVLAMKATGRNARRCPFCGRNDATESTNKGWVGTTYSVKRYCHACRTFFLNIYDGRKSRLRFLGCVEEHI